MGTGDTRDGCRTLCNISQEQSSLRPAHQASFDAAQERIVFLGCQEPTAGSCTIFHSLMSLSIFLFGCSQFVHLPIGIDTEDCPNPGVGSCIWPSLAE